MTPRLPKAVQRDLRPTILDRLVTAISPAAGLRRLQARASAVGWRLRTGQYQGAETTRPITRRWLRRAQSADDDVRGDQDTLRARARAAVRDMPLAASVAINFRTGIIGTGLRPFPRPDRALLGLSEEEADRYEAEMRRVWQAWAGSKWSSYDATRRFTAQQVMVAMALVTNGDHFAVFRRRATAGATQIGVCLQHLEADLISTPIGQELNPRISEGVEYIDGVAARIHIANQHPFSALNRQPTEWTSLPIWRDDARPMVLHIVDHDGRAGQTRGVTKLAPIIEVLKAVSDLTENELTAALVASFFTVFIPNSGGAAASLDVDTGRPVDANGQVLDPETDQLVDASRRQRDITQPPLELGSGLVAYGLPGEEKPEIIESKRPNQNMPPFLQALAQFIGAGTGLPSELLLKKFTASFTASQGAMLEAWRYFRTLRQVVIDEFCQPTYEEVIAEAVAVGRLDLPGFFTDEAIRAAWCAAEWRGPTKGHLNPVQESVGIKNRTETGLTCLEEERAEYNGGSWEDVHPKRAKEVRWRVRDGLQAPVTIPASDRVVGSAAETAPPLEDDSDDDTETA